MAFFRVAVGKEDFEAIRQEGSYYVDKTELIQKLINANNSVSLFTRPRRFGKTLAMSMLASFFDIRRDSRELFRGLEVAKHESFCRQWMNSHPVLFISLKGIEGLSYEKSYGLLKGRLADLAKENIFLLESSAVDQADKAIFERLRYEEADIADVCKSLKLFTRMLHDHFGKPVILLVDEYDVPLSGASEHNYYNEMLDIVRSLFDEGMKTNRYLKFAVVTGCLRIAKESVFTGTNNFKPYSILNKAFSTSFGFTPGEVRAFLAAAKQSDKFAIIREWYDGYIFGNSEIFCPWDVANYIADLTADPEEDAVPENYWSNTSGNDIIKNILSRQNIKVSRKFEILMNGGTISEDICDDMTYDMLHGTEDKLWTALFMTGYLTKKDKFQKGKSISLRIPNREIADLFEEKIVSVFRDSLNPVNQHALMEALWNGDEASASQIMSDLLWKTISYHDYHENFYHAFLAGIFTGLGYEVESNLEHGLGRTDIILRDDDRHRAIVIEAKKASSLENMEKSALKGMEQITDKRYAEDLYGYNSILCYAVAFFQKTALVKKVAFRA